MATTFKINNGDVVMNTSTGRPKLVGNTINENDPAKAREKTSLDLQRSLSIERLSDGSGAGIIELVGNVEEIGASSAQSLLNRRIRNMFSSILSLQRRRPGARPASERFARIILLIINADRQDPTTFRFRLDTQTAEGLRQTTSGTIG